MGYPGIPVIETFETNDETLNVYSKRGSHMKIIDVTVTKFRKDSWVGVDRDGHMHPSVKKDSAAALIQIHTDCGIPGQYFTAENYLIPSENYDKTALTKLCLGSYVPCLLYTSA